MPGSMPATSQLEWLSSTTAMIVLFWSRATRDLLKSFGWGIAALHRLHAATKLPSLAARPIASIGPFPRLSPIRAVPAETIRRSTDVFRRDREFDVSPGKGQHLQNQCSTDPGLIAGTWHRPLFLTRDRWFEAGFPAARAAPALCGTVAGLPDCC